ncbi:MAG TPA: 3-oxoadipate enol-lactonase, partial [Gaiellaceae bacterium]
MSLYHRFEGNQDGPVLVLSNSLGTTPELWDAQLPVLTPRFRVLLYDHPGHGGSPLPAQPTAIDDFVRPLVELLDELELERVSFCGLSLGGVVGMLLAAREPERVDRLVLACTGPRFWTPELWAKRAATARGQGLIGLVDGTLARWFTPGADPAEVARLREIILATPSEGYARACEALGGADAEPRLGEIRARTGVIAGAADPSVPPEMVELLGDRIPDVRVTVIPDSAHLANVEQPEAFNRALLDFL